MENSNQTVDGVRPRFLRRAEAARYVQESFGFACSCQWLAKLAVTGGGPVFRKAGRVPLYAPADLDDWALARIGGPQRTTSDKPAVANEKSPVPNKA